MELLHIWSSRGYKIVHPSEIEGDLIWDTVDDEGNEYPIKMEVVGKYYAHFQVSQLPWYFEGLYVYAYSLVILDVDGNIVGVKADIIETYVDDEKRAAIHIPIAQLAQEIIFNPKYPLV
jgi:phospholipase/lecithinase/hemolysin